MNNDEIKNDWKYFFIKYPIIYQYAEKGYITWHETPPENWQIKLLRGEKRSKNGIEELLLFLLRISLEEQTVYLKTDEYFHYLDIDFDQDKYEIAERGSQGDLYLRLWNNEAGTMILCELGSNVHGNNRAVKNLAEYGWEWKDDAFIIGGKKQLLKLTGNASLDLENLIDAFKKLLKKGFGIKI